MFSWVTMQPESFGLTTFTCFYVLFKVVLSLDILGVYLGVSHRIPWKNQNAVYRLQIPTLVTEIFKLRTCIVKNLYCLKFLCKKKPQNRLHYGFVQVVNRAIFVWPWNVMCEQHANNRLNKHTQTRAGFDWSCEHAMFSSELKVIFSFFCRYFARYSLKTSRNARLEAEQI